MLAVLVAGGAVDGHELPSSSKSCSTNSPGGIAEPAAAALGGEDLHDLRGMQAAAPAGGDDPLGALVERLQRLVGRIAELDD